MDQSSTVTPTNLSSENLVNEESGFDSNGNEENISRVDERNMRGQPTVDIAEVLRRWTHALQRIHKQSLQLVHCHILVLYFIYSSPCSVCTCFEL